MGCARCERLQIALVTIANEIQRLSREREDMLIDPNVDIYGADHERYRGVKQAIFDKKIEADDLLLPWLESISEYRHRGDSWLDD